MDMGALRRLGRVVIAAGGSTPGFCRCNDGTLLVSMRDTVEGYNDGQCCVSLVRSTDAGVTWSAPRVVVGDGANAGRGVLAHLGMQCLSTGEVLLPYRDLGPERAAWLIRSTDTGATWSAPEKLAPKGVADVGDWVWLMPFGNIRELGSGDVVMPVHGEMTGDEYWRSGLLRSVDKGKTWTQYNDICSGPDGMDNEMDVVELSTGDLIAIHRDWRSPQCGHGASFLYLTRSTDGGKTWSKPKLPQQAMLGHSPALFKTRSGMIICAYRYLDDLDMGLSGTGFVAAEPDGTHWSGFSQVICLTPSRLGWRATGMNSGYPAIDWIDGHRFMIVYQTKVGVHTPREIEGAIYVEEGYEGGSDADREAVAR